MMNSTNMTPLLSIVVISHNQCEGVRRCLDSILTMQLPFAYEIIVSDDRSTDGTWELIEEYVVKYTGLIYGYRCNSDDCSPTNTSERSGWNRCNAYPHAKGKYIVHIDGDDYLKGTDCYRRQVELLESHPECSMCMQNIWCVKDGEPIENGKSWHEIHKYKTGQIVTAKDFFLTNMFLLNQAFVMRRQPSCDPVDLYGKFYVDDIITFHHLQFGPIVCLDRCDYVYVDYPKSITSSLALNERDVIWALDLTVFCAIQIPAFAGLYYAGNLGTLLSSVNKIRKGLSLTEQTKNNFKQFNAFIYQVCIKKNKTLTDKIRLQIIRLWLIILVKVTATSSIAYKILHLLLVGRNFDPRCNFKIE